MPNRLASKADGAAVEIRTRDLFLTKEVLYLLSYSSKKPTHPRQTQGERIIKKIYQKMSIQFSG